MGNEKHTPRQFDHEDAPDQSGGGYLSAHPQLLDQRANHGFDAPSLPEGVSKLPVSITAGSIVRSRIEQPPTTESMIILGQE